MTLSISLNLTMVELLAHYTSASKRNLKLVKRDGPLSSVFKMCIIYHFFNCMYTTKIESCDAKVYKVAKECIEYCFPDPDIQDYIAECLLNCFEKHIELFIIQEKDMKKKEKELRCHLKIYLKSMCTPMNKNFFMRNIFIKFF